MSSANHPSVPATRGSGLVVVLVAIMVISSMALALVLLSITETMAARNGSLATSTLYAAHAGIERVLPDLSRLPDWTPALDGSVRSGFADGPPSGTRTLPDGRTINLEAIVNLANCGGPTACTPTEMDAVTPERPWGRNNPRWRLFAHGWLRDLVDVEQPNPDEYVVVLAGDDPSESDDDPDRDGRAGNPGEGRLLLRADAFGAAASHRSVEALVARGTPGESDGGYAAQRGQGATAAGAGASIQVPGGNVSRLEVAAAGGVSRR